METSLNLRTRHDSGKGIARKLRRAGRVPGVIYGGGEKPVPVSMEAHEALRLFQSISVENTILDLMVDEHEAERALVREVQAHPYRTELLHVDFLRVRRGVAIEVNIPVHVIGVPVGVREGGILEHVVHDITVKCIPSKIPAAIEVEVTQLDTGDVLRAGDLEMPEGVKIVWIEEVRKTIGTAERLKAFGMALFAPIGMLEKGVGAINRPQLDDLATIIFSSGSTGEPKGVMLSHFNVDANIEQVVQVFHLGPGDRVMGILPFFHSFGYLATLWLAVTHGVGVVYHPTPLDPGAIGDLMEKKRVTILIATPTFLQLYWRRCLPEQFGSVRVVLTGAEKLSERLAAAFEEKFGIRPFEGYGVTECSPVIAVNCPDFRAAGFHQPASRRGTVGQPLPGVSVRIVDPDSFEPLLVGTAGMLLVKGPNVMPGYLNRPDLTDGVMHDGWYVTGDVAVLDEDGFLTITDRLSRFAKIGGEMVPHGKVEEALQQAAESDEQVFAVTSIPDEKKGEQLAVLHTLDEAVIPGLLEKVAASGLPNLFIPRKDAFVKVEQLPVLGTGKLDLRALKRVALERLSAG